MRKPTMPTGRFCPICRLTLYEYESGMVQCKNTHIWVWTVGAGWESLRYVG